MYPKQIYWLFAWQDRWMNWWTNLWMNRWPTDWMKDWICSWVVSLKAPEDMRVRICFVLHHAVHPDSQATMFRMYLLLWKKQQVLPKRWYLSTCMASHSSRSQSRWMVGPGDVVCSEKTNLNITQLENQAEGWEPEHICLSDVFKLNISHAASFKRMLL
jgi:hypothetical protein